VTSIQNIPDSKRVEAITIGRQTRSKIPPTRVGAQRGAGHSKTKPQTPADDAPPVQLHADGDQEGQIFWTGGASRHPTAMHKAFIAALKQVKTGKFDADGDEL
jgi:hypothetical protein